MSRVRRTKESMSRELETTGLGEGQEASYWHVSEESSSSLHEVARRRTWLQPDREHSLQASPSSRGSPWVLVGPC